MKSWNTPNLVPMTMNAEVGAYQEDFGTDPDVPPVLAAPAAAAFGSDRAEERAAPSAPQNAARRRS